MYTNNEKEYIVKFKDVNTVLESNRKSNHLGTIIGCIVLVLIIFVEIIVGLIIKNLMLKPIVFLTVLILLFLFFSTIDKNWVIELRDKKLYIKTFLKKYTLNIDDLIKFSFSSVSSVGLENSFQSETEFLWVEYRKNEKIKRISLKISELYYRSMEKFWYVDEKKLKEFLSCFKTNYEIEGMDEEELLNYVDVRLKLDDNRMEDLLDKYKTKYDKVAKWVIIITAILVVLIIAGTIYINT